MICFWDTKEREGLAFSALPAFLGQHRLPSEFFPLSTQESPPLSLTVPFLVPLRLCFYHSPLFPFTLGYLLAPQPPVAPTCTPKIHNTHLYPQAPSGSHLPPAPCGLTCTPRPHSPQLPFYLWTTSSPFPSVTCLELRDSEEIGGPQTSPFPLSNHFTSTPRFCPPISVGAAILWASPSPSEGRH